MTSLTRRPRACEPGDVPEPLLAALRAAVARGARVLSVCTGAFVLGAAGLRLTGQRVLRAQQLLEETDDVVDRVAEQAGFGNAAAFRHHFRAWRGTTPHSYGRTFRTSAEHGASADWGGAAG